MRMDGSFAWPERYQMLAVCGALQRVGCCAPTFQVATTAFFMSRCSISNARQIALLSQRCVELGVLHNFFPLTLLQLSSVLLCGQWHNEPLLGFL